MVKKEKAKEKSPSGSTRRTPNRRKRSPLQGELSLVPKRSCSEESLTWMVGTKDRKVLDFILTNQRPHRWRLGSIVDCQEPLIGWLIDQMERERGWYWFTGINHLGVLQFVSPLHSRACGVQGFFWGGGFFSASGLVFCLRMSDQGSPGEPALKVFFFPFLSSDFYVMHSWAGTLVAVDMIGVKIRSHVISLRCVAFLALTLSLGCHRSKIEWFALIWIFASRIASTRCTP